MASAGALSVLTFGYRDFKILAYNRTFKECRKKIKDTGSATSNSIRHLETHPDRSVQFTLASE